MSDEVFLAEYIPDGDGQGVQLYRQPRVSLIGIFSSVEKAEEEIQKVFSKLNKFAFDGKYDPLRSTKKPKGIFMTTDGGRLTFGRIRPITVDAAVDSVLKIW